jgi:hypothetical protein
MRLRASGAMVAFGLSVGLLPGAQVARADTCDTSWASPADGLYDQSVNWTNGVPTLQTTACLPAFDGTPYTVTIRDNRSVAETLDIAQPASIVLIDGPGGARFQAASGIHNAGALTVQTSRGGQYDLETGAGSLVNDGNLVAQTPLLVSSLDNTTGQLNASATVDIGELVNLTSGQLSGGLISTSAAVHLPSQVQTLAGIVALDGSGTVTDPTGGSALRGLAEVTLRGELFVSNGASVATAAQLHNAGEVAVQSGGVLQASRGYVQDAGVTSVADGGTLRAARSGLQNLAGVLQLISGGHVVGTVVNKAELLVATTTPAPSVIEGTLTERRGSLLHFLASTGQQLSVTGAVQLASSLFAEAIRDALQPGDTITLLSAPSITGTAKVVSNDFAVTFGAAQITATRQFAATEDDPAVSYGGWHAAASPAAADGVIHESNIAGDTAKASLDHPIDWHSVARPDGGFADVLVNGALLHTISTYAPGPPQFLNDSISSDRITLLAIRVNGGTPAGSTGSWVSVAGVTGVGNTIDDSDFSYDGWSLVHDGANAYRVSSQPGVPASLSFDGTSVEWVTQTGPDRGRADVLIDGTLRSTVDTWSRNRKNGIVEGFSGLAPGHHTLQIVPLATANRRSTGTGVVVDEFVAS